MSNDHEHNGPRPTQPQKGKEQFPVDTDVLTLVRLSIDELRGDLVKIAVMNNLSTSTNQAYTEYYHGNAAESVEGIEAFSLIGSSTTGSQQHIDDFVGAFPLHLSIAQPCSWCRGVYAPQGAQKRLFQATDPDDSTRRIGLLIEQDTQGKITQVAWYKTTDTGAVFSKTPSALAFTRVKDGDGNDSLDPNDIGGWTWYYTTSMGPCS
jgi:hypothetical protein